MKYFFTLFVSIALAALYAPTVQAGLQDPVVIVNNTPVETGSHGPHITIFDDRILVDADTLADALGLDIEHRWNSVILRRQEVAITFRFDSTTMMVAGDEFTPDVPAQNIDGTFMLPLRAVAEAAGFDVIWCEVSRTAYVNGHIPVLDPVAPIQRTLGAFYLGMTPEEVVAVFAQRGSQVERAVNIGRIDHLGGHSFIYQDDYTWIMFDSSGRIERIYNRSNSLIVTANGIGAGDTLSRVIEVYGNNFRTSPFGPGGIEYFDGEVFISFNYTNISGTRMVRSWGIGNVSGCESFLRGFGF
jgi:hypothetical protein